VRSASTAGRRCRRWAAGAAVAAVAAGFVAGCTSGDTDSAGANTPDSLDAKLAAAFRVDLTAHETTLDYWPANDHVRGAAVLHFEMRPGQSRALFHFNPSRRLPPGREREMLTSLQLDGERLDPSDPADLQIVRTGRAAEPAFEVQRELAPDATHELRVRWSSPTPKAPPGWFYPNFDDTVGPRDETETLWPTISSPEELTRHRIRLRVHADRPYTMLGSGAIRRTETSGVQTWELDTRRPIASHTVFFAAIPCHQVRVVSFDAGGVRVRIVSDRSPAVVRRARQVTQKTIDELTDDFGPFPMPTMQILLTGWGSGMEYLGATRTGIGSLRHELGHMYFGAATVNRTWRDTWIDESVVVWWEGHDRHRHSRPLPPWIQTDIASGRTVVEPGFDLAAYGLGARVLGLVAHELGGNRQMIAFLADLHRRRAFHPYTTDDLIDDLVATQPTIDRTQLEHWLFD
jgi:hypothetical protein